MKKILLLATLIVSISTVCAQGFNGSIDFKYYTAKDTMMSTYFIKDDHVKLENYSKKTGGVEGAFYFDIAAGTIKWINPKRKLWGPQKSETPPIIHGKCETSKGTATKTILGYKCSDYTVKNTDENTTVTYWITTEKFNFFIPMLKLWNRKDKQSVYFNQITGLPEGSMPLLSEEKQISDGKVISKLEAIKISKTAPGEASMQVPADYTKFDK